MRELHAEDWKNTAYSFVSIRGCVVITWDIYITATVIEYIPLIVKQSVATIDTDWYVVNDCIDWFPWNDISEQWRHIQIWRQPIISLREGDSWWWSMGSMLLLHKEDLDKAQVIVARRVKRNENGRNDIFKSGKFDPFLPQPIQGGDFFCLHEAFSSIEAAIIRSRDGSHERVHPFFFWHLAALIRSVLDIVDPHWPNEFPYWLGLFTGYVQFE